MTYVRIAQILILIGLGLLVGSCSVYNYMDRKLQEKDLIAAAEKKAIQDTLIERYVGALKDSKTIRDTVATNQEKIQHELDAALDRNDDLRRDIRTLSVRVKAPACSAVGSGGGNAASTDTAYVEVADEVRWDLFDLRESIIRDQAALKERDAWIAEVSKYSLCPTPPSP